MNDDFRRRVEDRLGERIVHADPIVRDPSQPPKAWHVTDAVGREFAAKHVGDRRPVTRGDRGLLDTEWAILSMLCEMGCAVPTPVAVDAECGLLITEWIDGDTLDDLCQLDPDRIRPFVPKALASLQRIERALEARAGDVEPYVFALDFDGYLGTDFDYFADSAWSGFRQLVGGGADEPECHAAWRRTLEAIRSSQPTLGTLDYNARNLLFRGTEPVFLDFSTIGWDWPERRVVQYFTSLGAYRPEGNFVQALRRDGVHASRSTLHVNPDALEAHLVLFLCLAVERLLRAGIADQAGMDSGADPGWANRQARFDTVAGLLANDGLSDFPPTILLRDRVRMGLGMS